MFSSEAWLSNSSDFYNSVATQSLRFDRGGSTYLNRTPSSTTNNSKWTWSGWIKRGNLNTTFPNTYNYFLFGASPNSNSQSILYYHSTSNALGFYIYNGSSFLTNVSTDAIFRDTSAWYHVVFIFDCANSTASDRAIFYVNGERQTTDTTASTSASYVNQNVFHTIGIDARLNATLGTFDGYMAEVNFLDGIAIGDTDADGYLDEFGEIKNGVWIPKAYTGSYGTNGFRLQFNQTGTGSASSSTIGADTSGNANHYTSSGIVASDCAMPDSPENNFPTINVLHRGSSYSSTTTSEGNLSFKHSNLAHASAIASMVLPKSGKWYWETLNNSNATSGTNTIGVVGSTFNNSSALSGAGSFFWANGFGIYGSAGQNFGSALGVTWDTTGSATSFTANDIIGVAYDADNKNIEWYKNGTLMDYNVTDFNDTDNDIMPASSAYGNPANAGIIFNFGQDPSFAGSITAGTETPSEGAGVFKHAVPSGYLALCTANLPEPTISPNADTQADDYFNTVLYIGNATDNRSITGVGFQPDFVWLKARSSAQSHELYDVVRGATKRLRSDLAETEANAVNNLQAFESDGFEIGDATSINGSGNTMVSWNWKAGGTAVSNTDGSITSSVSANTTAGFSIVTYTGTGSNATVGHGLNVAPNYMIIKSRDSAVQDWTVYSEEIGNTKNMALNTTGAEETATTNFNSTSPTSTVFSIGTRFETNESGASFVAFCFHNVEGYSRFGKYFGSGDSDGTFVYTGFSPTFLIIKRTDVANSWFIKDTARSYNGYGAYLYADLSNAENTSTTATIDKLSNGFKIRATGNGVNNSSGTYIYMAFAENPFKYANAR